MSRTRRNLILLAGLAGFYGLTRAVPGVYDRLNASFDFEPMDDPPGFRRLRMGEVSAPFDPFIGVGEAAPDFGSVTLQDFEAALFSGGADAGTVQIAYFSDFYCPYCRVLSSQLIRVAEETGAQITWHEVPLFGPASELAARAAIAAGLQGAYVPFHDRLIKTPVQVTPRFVDRIAQSLGLDVARFAADRDSPAADRALAVARALFARFGFIGTPGLVVGRTVVNGAIGPTNLTQLIRLETRDSG